MEFIYLSRALRPPNTKGQTQTRHRAEFSDTSGTFSIARSAKFEIARVKRRETIGKWPKTAQHRLLLAFFHSIQHTDRLGTLGLLKKRYQAFILNIFLSR